jgi:hypothetical protein
VLCPSFSPQELGSELVFGVISVDNQLQVKLMNDERREDADLRGDVLQALMLDGLVPSTVDAKVGGRLCHPHRHRRLTVRA